MPLCGKIKVKNPRRRAAAAARRTEICPSLPMQSLVEVETQRERASLSTEAEPGKEPLGTPRSLIGRNAAIAAAGGGGGVAEDTAIAERTALVVVNKGSNNIHGQAPPTRNDSATTSCAGFTDADFLSRGSTLQADTENSPNSMHALFPPAVVAVQIQDPLLSITDEEPQNSRSSVTGEEGEQQSTTTLAIIAAQQQSGENIDRERDEIEFIESVHEREAERLRMMQREAEEERNRLQKRESEDIKRQTIFEEEEEEEERQRERLQREREREDRLQREREMERDRQRNREEQERERERDNLIQERKMQINRDNEEERERLMEREGKSSVKREEEEGEEKNYGSQQQHQGIAARVQETFSTVKRSLTRGYASLRSGNFSEGLRTTSSTAEVAPELQQAEQCVCGVFNDITEFGERAMPCLLGEHADQETEIVPAAQTSPSITMVVNTPAGPYVRQIPDALVGDAVNMGFISEEEVKKQREEWEQKSGTIPVEYNPAVSFADQHPNA